MNVTDALATSPNTAFAKLISQVGVQRTVDMAVKLGLRSYAEPGTARDYDPDSNESLADFVKRQNLGSFTLGPFEVNAAGVVQCRGHAGLRRHVVPAEPDRQGVRPQRQRGRGHHRDLRAGGSRGAGQHAGQRDEQGRPGAGTAAGVGRFGRAGTCRCRARPAPPRRTARRASSASPTATRRPTTSTTTPPSPADLCSSPLRHCGDGNLFGGNEPARTWFTAMKPIANNFGDVRLPPTDPRYVDGAPGSGCPASPGMTQDAGAPATQGGRLPGRRPGQPGQQHGAAGDVVGTSPTGQTIPGSIITIQTSNGIPPAPPPPPPDCRRFRACRRSRLDGHRDPRPATDHHSGAGPPPPPPPTSAIAVAW